MHWLGGFELAASSFGWPLLWFVTESDTVRQPLDLASSYDSTLRTIMSGLSSFFPPKFLSSSSVNPRERTTDPLAHLKFVFETLPGARKYVFTPATRAEILSELYDAFWGPYAHLFLPNSNSSLPLHKTLSEVQASLGLCGAGKPAPVIPGRPCGHILKKGESCFRCKCVALVYTTFTVAD